MKHLFLIILLGLAPMVNTFAQKEANIWYFGDHLGLDFNNGAPSLLLNGNVTNGAYGSAVLSDENGNLLFYTDGVTVWNKNHAIMLNGNSLSGNMYASQSALITQHPGNEDLYYIFTTDYNTNGFQYSMVDITLDGGLGGVISKNNPLFTPSTEKITATWHANNTDLWILAHEKNTDAFYAYLINNSGLVTTPVVSHAGGNKSGYSVGNMKVSPSGNQLAIALKDTVGIFSFNNSTGVIGDLFSIPVYGITNEVEYSPDGSKLYFTYFDDYAPPIINRVYQVNLLAGDENQIKNSSTYVISDTITFLSYPLGVMAALELGPDGKLYVLAAKNEYLDVINMPDLTGAGCNYLHNALYLGGRKTDFGLPNFAPIYTSKKFNAFNLCSSYATYFAITNTSSISSVLWNFNDPNSTQNTSGDLNPLHVYSQAGIYDVSLTVTYSNNNIKTAHRNITIEQTPELELGNDTVICAGNNFTLHLPHPEYYYVWNDNSHNTNFTINHDGSYWVKASLGQCSRSDTIKITNYPTPKLLPEGIVQVCFKDTFRIMGSENNATYLWKDGSTNPFLDVTTAGTYQADVTYQCGTVHVSKIIENISCCTPYIPNLLTANNDGKNEELIISCIEDGQWQLEVYNRWGDRVFQSNDYHNELKGQQLEEGVYYYSLSKKGKNTYKGWVHILK